MTPVALAIASDECMTTVIRFLSLVKERYQRLFGSELMPRMAVIDKANNLRVAVEEALQTKGSRLCQFHLCQTIERIIKDVLSSSISRTDTVCRIQFSKDQ